MEKKEVLQSASQTIATKESKPSWIKRCWGAFKSRMRKIWNWINGDRVAGTINVVLLCLIIVFFSFLVINLWDARDANNGRGGSVMFNNATAHNNTTGTEMPTKKSPIIKKTVSADVAFDTKSENITITLPLRDVVTPKPAPEKKSGNVVYLDNGNGNDLIMDGRNPDGSIIRPMTQINGNVFLQNMHGYALPCGVKINGNLFVRNVRMLKFCGCFEVTGNIYVSSNSSFGPIPAGSRLGGQIIF